MMKTILLSLTGAALVLAQTPDMKTASGMAQAAQSTIKRNILRAAEKMPESDYGFQPVPEVRTFGQLLGHVANAEYNYCSSAAGEKSPNTVNVEKTKTSKADLTAALQAAFDYCDKIYAGATDAKVADMGKQGNNERNKLGLLMGNVSHANEHYGNIVTYMRIKGIVPPSSEPK